MFDQQDQVESERVELERERVELEREVRAHKMTVGELVDLLSDDNFSRRDEVEFVLNLILEKAENFYACWDEIGYDALRVASLATDGIVDKHTAKDMAEYMAVLANTMLQAEGAGEWDFATLIALKRIRRSDPEFAEREQKQGGPVMSNGKTQAEIDAQIVF